MSIRVVFHDGASKEYPSAIRIQHGTDQYLRLIAAPTATEKYPVVDKVEISKIKELVDLTKRGTE